MVDFISLQISVPFYLRQLCKLTDKSQQELAKFALIVFHFHLGRNKNLCLSCVCSILKP